MRTLFRDVEVEGRRCDVVVGPTTVEQVGSSLVAADVDEVIDGRGGALVPGLHDHHIHLLASAAARLSVDCATGLDALAHAPAGAWVRGVAAADSVDRWTLDRLVPDRPVRVQHRSGGLWMLNSRALALVDHVLDGPDVERDERGEPTGRLWRYDERLRPALPPAEVETLDALQDFVAELHSYGITSVTDATPELDAGTVDALRTVDLDVTLLGDPRGSAPWKILVRDHDLPTLEDLSGQIALRHAEGRAVAVHCVSRESLLLTLAALEDVGRVPGDRIEHGGVVPPDVRTRLVGLTVVTQPAMLSERSERYRAEVHPDDLDCLYPHATLLAAGVDVWLSSDAPFGPADPWQALRAARDRDLVPAERVSPDRAITSFFRDAAGQPRQVVPGAPGRLCLLEIPWSAMQADPRSDAVRLVRGDGMLHGR